MKALSSVSTIKGFLNEEWHEKWRVALNLCTSKKRGKDAVVYFLNVLVNYCIGCVAIHCIFGKFVFPIFSRLLLPNQLWRQNYSYEMEVELTCLRAALTSSVLWFCAPWWLFRVTIGLLSPLIVTAVVVVVVAVLLKFRQDARFLVLSARRKKNCYKSPFF